MEESTVPLGSGLPVGREVAYMEPAGKFIKKVTEIKIDRSGKRMRRYVQLLERFLQLDCDFDILYLEEVN